MKVYTKTGDNGTTSLFGGTRVSKSDARINAYGTVDELNAYLGLLRDQPVNARRKNEIVNIQEDLFVIGAILATEPGKDRGKIPSLQEEDVQRLEGAIDNMDGELPPMKNFILPGGHQSVSFCHVARCVCRRAERLVIALREQAEIAGLVVKYLNRLSDYLFVLSRKVSREVDAEEIPWLPRK